MSWGLRLTGIAALGLMILCLTRVDVLGQTVPETSIRYRRIEIPADHIEPFVRGLWPTPREEFERLVQEPADLHVNFASATYVATLDGATLRGQCSMRTADRPPGSNRYLNMVGEFAMSRPFWTAGDRRYPALLGRHGEDTILVEEASADAFEFDWSLRGKAVGEGLRFELHLPKAVIHELRITLPDGLAIRAQRGIVIPPAAGSNQWILQSSGNDELVFWVTASSRRTGAGDVRQRTQYEFRRDSLQLTSEISVFREANSPPAESLRLDLDPGISLTSVKVDELDVRWTARERGGSYELELPDSLPSERGWTLRVEALADFPRGELAVLPRISVDGRWTSESLRCEFAESLEISDLRLKGCELPSNRSLRDLRSLDLVMNAENWTVEIRVDRKSTETSARVVTHLEFEANSVIADVAIRMEPLEGEVFDLLVDMNTASGWLPFEDTLDAVADTSVLGLPASILDRYKLSSVDDHQQLSVRLRQAATSQRPVDLQLRLRNDSLRNGSPLSDLLPLTVRNADDVSYWLHLKDSPGLDLIPLGAEHAEWYLEGAQPPPDWLARNDLYVKCDSRSELVRIERRAKPALTRIECKTEVYFSPDQWRQTIDLEVDPLGKEVNRLEVIFSQPIRVSDLVWTLNERIEALAVKKIEPQSGDPASWTRCEIAFDPRSEAFALRAEYVETLDERVPIPLASIRQASSRRATLAIFSEGPIGLDISAGEGLQAIPLESLAKPESAARKLRGAYSYNHTTASIPELLVRRERLPIRATLSAWRCDIRSYFPEKGRARHRADYFLQNEGAPYLRLTFPREFALDSVEIDGQMLAQQRSLQDGQLTIPLPADQQFPCVTVRYVQQQQQALRAIDWLGAPLLESNIPSMQTTWQVWLPRDYRSLAPGFSKGSDGWMQRLAGPFAKDSGPRWMDATLRKLRRRMDPGARDFSTTIDQMQWLLGTKRLVRSGRTNEDTWGSRLLDIKLALARFRSDFEVLIDREELRRIGVYADLPLPATRYTSPPQIGLDRLVQSGLAMIVQESQLIITSACELKERSRVSDLIDGIALEGDGKQFPASRLQRIEDWQKAANGRLWRPPQDRLEIGLQRGGWSPHRSLIAGPGSTLKIYHRDTAIALACGLFFGGYALGWRSSGRNRRRWFRLSMGFMAAALVMPQPGASLIVVFAWAIVLSGFMRFVSKSENALQIAPKRQAILRLATPWAANWLLIVLLSLGQIVKSNGQLSAQVNPGSSTHQTDVATTPTELAAETNVYFPVNQDRRPANVVYMPREFYTLLQQRHQPDQDQPAFLFRRAVYAGDWPSQSDQELRLTAKYELTTFVPNCAVALPDFGQFVTIDWDSIRIDRIPKSVAFDTGLGSRIIRIERRGDYRLSLDLRAPMRAKLGRQQVRFPVPPLPEATLQLNLPRELQGIEINSALGSIETGLTRGIVSAELGPAAELHIQARTDTIEQQGIEQISLLRIGETGSELETRFHFEREAGPINLMIDSNLEPIAESIASMDWDPDTRKLNTGPIDSKTKLRFRVLSPVSVGRFRVPEVLPLDADLRDRRLAVISHAKLRVGVASNEVSVPPDGYTLDWPDLAAAPDLIIRLGEGAPWLQLSRAKSSVTWNCEIAYFFDVARTNFELTAQLIPTASSSITYRRLVLPQSMAGSMAVHQIRATSSRGIPFRIRWRHQANELILFFDDRPEISATDPVDILISGELLTDGNGGLQELPLIVPEALPSEEVAVSQNVVLYRASDVILNVDPLATVSINMDQDDIANRNGFRFAGSWSSDDFTLGDREAVAFAVTKQPAQRTLSGSLTTTMRHDEAGWSADVEATVFSSDGIIDVVHFDVPSSMTTIKPIVMEGDSELRVDDIAGGPGLDRRILSVWLPIGEATKNAPRTITFTTRLLQEQTKLPHVRFLNVNLAEENGQPQHFVVLPGKSTSSEASNFNWRQRGLSELSDNADANTSRYLVTQRDFAAELDETATGIRPEVYLLETTVGWRSDRQFLAMSQYDLKPTSLASEIIAELPAATDLIQVMCDDIPAYFKEVSRTDKAGRAYRIQLTSRPWPQRIRIIFHATAVAESAEVIAIRSPSLSTSSGETQTEIPVLKELWTIYSTGNHALGKPIGRGDRLILAENDYGALRLAAFSSLWSNSQVTLRERTREETSAWLTTWAKRFAELIRNAQVRGDDVEDPARDTMNQLLAEYANVFDPELTSSASARKSMQPADLWNESQWLSGTMLRYESAPPAKGEFPGLRIKYAGSAQRTSLMRLMMCGLFALAAIALPNSKNAQRVLRFFSNHPPMLAMSLGLTWWLILSPRSLGLLIAMTGAAVWIASIVRQRRLLRLE